MNLLTKWCGLCLMTLLMGLLSVSSISARDLTTAERASLAETIERFVGLTKTRDWPAIIELSIPPRMMDEMLKGSSDTREQLIKRIADYVATTLAKVEFQSSKMDLAGARKGEHADGMPYLLIPTEAVMTVGGKKIAIRSHTLGMMDGGNWYLLRVSDLEQARALIRAYPEYENVEFPSETREVLKE